jgi:membrane protein CcdC involved in cytochrome C biogenesis
MNYLGFLSILSIIGLIGFIRRDSAFVFSFFAFLVYTGYFQVTPDEMFIKRVYKSSGVTLLITLILMTGLFVGYLLTENVNFFTNGFWISFTVMIVSFPLAFTFFQLRDE